MDLVPGGLMAEQRAALEHAVRITATVRVDNRLQMVRLASEG